MSHLAASSLSPAPGLPSPLNGAAAVHAQRIVKSFLATDARDVKSQVVQGVVATVKQ